MESTYSRRLVNNNRVKQLEEQLAVEMLKHEQTLALLAGFQASGHTNMRDSEGRTDSGQHSV